MVKLNDCDLTRSTNTKRLTNETKKVSQLEINVATLSHVCDGSGSCSNEKIKPYTCLSVCMCISNG